MKLTKSEFKGMIKECIKELIKEGAFNQALKESGLGVSSSSSKSAPKVLSSDPYAAAKIKNAAARMTGYDEKFMDEAGQDHPSIVNNQHLQSIIESTAKSMSKGNSKDAEQYAAIFADTAVNTLPKMMMNDPQRSGYGSLVQAGMQAHQEKVAAEDLEHLAGPTKDVGRWATLAFGGKPPEKNE